MEANFSVFSIKEIREIQTIKNIVKLTCTILPNSLLTILAPISNICQLLFLPSGRKKSALSVEPTQFSIVNTEFAKACLRH